MDFLKKGQKIRAWVDPPPHSGNARKKTFFFHWCLPLFEEYLRNCVNQTLHKHFAFYNKNAISSFQDSLVSYILWNTRYATPHIIVALRTPRNGERKYGYDEIDVDADCWHPKRFPAIKFSDFPQNKHMSNDQVQYLLVKDCVRFWFLNFSLYTQWSTLSGLSSGRGWTFLMIFCYPDDDFDDDDGEPDDPDDRTTWEDIKGHKAAVAGSRPCSHSTVTPNYPLLASAVCTRRRISAVHQWNKTLVL